MTEHSNLCDQIKKYLTSVGAWHYRSNSHGYGRKGIPDIIGCYRGSFFSIEAKVKRDTPSPWQERELADIRAAGGIGLVVYHADEVRQFFDRHFRQTA